MKTRNDAAKILLSNGWTFEEVEKVLIRSSTPKKAPAKKVITKTKK